MERIPYYFINGFLESGKTEFIKYTLSQDYFRMRETTLLIVCEEGIEEYDEKLLKKNNTVIEYIEDEEDFNKDKLKDLIIKHKPARIVIEYNGMWDMKNIDIPNSMELAQQITIIDGTTYDNYFQNMRSLMAEMVRRSELVIVNRCDAIEDYNACRRNLKAINPSAEIVLEDANGEVEEEMVMPFDVEADHIDLTDETYGIWFLDAMDNIGKYEGKTISYTAMVMKPEGMQRNYFVPGRPAMTCCADDMTFMGYICFSRHAVDYNNKDWIKLIAEVKYEFRHEYDEEGPVLYAKSIERTSAPKQPIITF
ncbi:MAG: GTPase [Lachnospiraceae bacterium]|nr:GTPase [Lachnospiraceae bacterium]